MSEQTTLGDFIDRTGGGIQTGPFGTKLKASEYTATGAPVISVGEVGEGRLRLHKKTPKVDETVWGRMPEYLLKTNDVVFGRKGAVERSAQVLPEEDGYFLGSDGIRVRLNPRECEPKFIAYHFQSKEHKNWMVQHAAGTTMPSLNEGIIRRIPLKLPPLPEQKAIAHILGSLDDKIELNRKINETLEDMAKALFKSWFSDFDPVIDNILVKNLREYYANDSSQEYPSPPPLPEGEGPTTNKFLSPWERLREGILYKGIPEEFRERAEVRLSALRANAELGMLNAETHNSKFITHHSLFPSAFRESEELGWIPEGWDVGTIADHAEITMGQSPKGDTYNNLGDGVPLVNGPVEFGQYFTNQSKWTTSPTKLSEKDDLIVCVRGSTTGRFVKSDGQYCLGRGVCSVRARRYQCFVDQIFKSSISEMLGLTTGSTFPNWSRQTLSGFEVIDPPISVIDQFENFMTANTKRIESGVIESGSLSNLRDTLLPKLISRELQIEDAEKMVEEARL